MNTRRPTHSAQDGSFSKWTDPIVYRDPWVARLEALLYLLMAPLIPLTLALAWHSFARPAVILAALVLAFLLYLPTNSGRR